MLGCSYLGRTADSHFHLVLAIPRVLDTSSATTLDDDWLALEARWFVTVRSVEALARQFDCSFLSRVLYASLLFVYLFIESSMVRHATVLPTIVN
jgi:hypothetical protein